jgi:hypothetical protein
LALSQLTAKQIGEALVGIIYRFRGRLHRLEQDTLEEAAKRVRRHEALVRDVLPELCSRLGEAEDAIRGEVTISQPVTPPLSRRRRHK